MANNSTIVNIGVDITQLKQGVDDLRNQFSQMSTTINASFQNSTQLLNQVTNALQQQITTVNNAGNSWQQMGQQQTQAITSRLDTMINSLNKNLGNLQQNTNNTLNNISNGSQQAFNQMSQNGQKACRHIKGEVGLLQKGLDYLQGTITRVFYFGLVLKFGEALHNVAKEGMTFEKQISSLTALTNGSVNGAKQIYSMISDLANKIPYEVDEIVKSSLILNKTGLQPTEKLLESIAKIATGTGQSMFTQATALSSVVTGNLRGLRQMGILAKDNGKTLSLTFKGETEVIEKNTKALEDYINRLADKNYTQALNYQMDGLTGKAKVLSETWAEFSRQLFFSGGKQILMDMYDKFNQKLRSIIEWLQKPETIESIAKLWKAFSNFGESISNLFGFIGKGLVSLIDVFNSFFETYEDNTDITIKNTKSSWTVFFTFLKNAFNGFAAVLNGVIRTFTQFEGIGNEWFETMTGTSYSDARSVLWAINNESKALKKAYADEMYRQNELKEETEKLSNGVTITYRKEIKEVDRLTDSYKHYEKEYDKVSKELGKNIKNREGWSTNNTDLKNMIRAIGSAEELNQKVTKATQEYDELYKGINQDKVQDPLSNFADEFNEINKKTDEAGNKARKNLEGLQDLFKNFEFNGEGTTFGSTGSSKGGKEQKDTWTSYYEGLLQQQLSYQDKYTQLQVEHQKALAELDKKANENQFVNEQMKNNALLLINQDYYEKLKQLKMDAYSFIGGIGKDSEIVALEVENAQKLQQLEMFHNQGLMSEDTYNQALNELRKKYYDQDIELQMKKRNEPYLKTADALKTVSDGLNTLTSNLNENSAAYKVAFALQKSFAVASATMNAMVAWTEALKGPHANWYEGLAKYAQAVALTTNILGELSSVTMHDKGGSIASGALGIVGEYGPELVRGPANITSRKQTEDLLSNRGDNNITVNLIEDSARAGKVEKKTTDEETIINVCVSNIYKGGELAESISSVYGLARQGI